MNNITDKKSKRKFVIYIIILAVLALHIVGAIAMIIVNRNQPKIAQEEYKALATEVHTTPAAVEFELLREKNTDICAWLISEGTGIDYPIVQGEDNEYYRRHLFSGDMNRFGCLYIDAAQTADFSEKNTVIYGGSQLDSIYKYARQDYYDILPSMTICTPDETYTLLLYAGARTDNIEGAIKTDFADNAEFMDYLSWLKENSAFHSNVSISESDKIVTLCANNGKEGFVLVGKLA